MRISDWSSDVCSSDLSLGMLSAIVQRQRGKGHEPVDGHRRAQDVEQFHGGDIGIQQVSVRIPMLEIGRASCRERVCQYVLIAVVAVSLNKNYYNEVDSR